MPVSCIEVKKRWPAAQRQALIEALHAALVEALKIPLHDKLIRLIEHQPDNFVTPPNSSENYTLVQIALFPGRSLAAKRALYQAIVQRFGALGIAAEDIRILLQEIPMADWGIRGGIAACDVDFDYKIDV